MRRLLALVLAVAVLTVACGSGSIVVSTDGDEPEPTPEATPTEDPDPDPTPAGDPDPDPTPDPTPDPQPPEDLGPDDVVWELSTGGGFVPYEFALREWPEILVLGDGRVVRPGVTAAVYPGPALPAVEQVVIGPGEVARILDRIAESGLFDDPPEFGFPGVTDMPSTQATTTDGASISAYALYHGDPFASEALTDDEAQARQAFTQLIADISVIVDGVDVRSELIVPPAMVVNAIEYFEREPGLGGDPVAWPLDPALLAYDDQLGRGCAVVAGADLDALIEVVTGANEASPWVVGGETYQLVFRPHYPHQRGCGF